MFGYRSRRPHAKLNLSQSCFTRVPAAAGAVEREGSFPPRCPPSSLKCQARGPVPAKGPMTSRAGVSPVLRQPTSRVASALAGEIPAAIENGRENGKMAIHIVTHRKGGSATEVTAVVSRLKAAALRSGAEDFRLSIELAGPEAGQWILVIRFSDMASFGRAIGSALADPDSRAILEDLEKVSPMTSCRIVAEVDL